MFLAVLAALPAVRQAPAQTAPPANPPPPEFRAGLGDLMTMWVQPRHIKLGLAGQAGNWSYAAYELHEMQEAFQKVARQVPQWRSMPVAEMLPALTKVPLAAMERAIQAQDAARFAAAYEQLTEGCNQCHQAADRGMIVIRGPTGNPFPDQDFRPRAP